jgi:TonB family protein
MSTDLAFDNLVAYTLQIGMLVGVAAVVPALLRLRQPVARLVYWQILLAACLLLPLQPWKQVVLSGTVDVTSVIATVQAVHRPAPFHLMPRSEIALLVVLAGVVVRLGWLAIGFWKLRRYRRHSRPLEPAPAWSVEASLLVSEEIASPVTFGWRKPVVLLPAGFTALPPQVQEAILCHEIMHVRRGDWLFTVVEELVRATFWFHPAIWWLLGEIGLAREQEVDRLAIEITNERDEYMDALLAIASAQKHLDLAPAPLFLRKRHLRQRVILILKEARMSKTRVISTLTTGLAVLAAAFWLATGAFPLTAEPQVVSDAAGVTVNLNGSSVLHRTAVQYPAGARQHGVQGAVSVEVKLDGNGNVADAHVLSGPDELRRAVLESVLQWHFTRDAADTTRTVQIAFEMPKEAAAEEAVPAPSGVAGGPVSGVPGGVPGVVVRTVGGATTSALFAVQPSRISTIRVIGLSDQARTELLSNLPVHEGYELTAKTLQQTNQAAKAFDEHLIVQRNTQNLPDGTAQTTLTISATPSAMMATGSPFTSTVSPRIKVGAQVQGAMVIKKVMPVYPPLAKMAMVQGNVQLAALIGMDGTVQELHVLGGPALLIQAAMDAVKQWVYKITYLNGNPAAVETTVDVNFTLNQ